MSDYSVKCRDCIYGEGTEKTEWVWCTGRKRQKLVHKDGSCGVGVKKPEEGEKDENV